MGFAKFFLHYLLYLSKVILHKIHFFHKGGTLSFSLFLISAYKRLTIIFKLSRADELLRLLLLIYEEGALADIKVNKNRNIYSLLWFTQFKEWSSEFLALSISIADYLGSSFSVLNLELDDGVSRAYILMHE